MVLIINTSINPHIYLLDDADKSAKNFYDLGKTKSTAETLLPAIDLLLKKNKKKLNDVQVVAVCVGPGSFTGTRVAISTAFALCFEDARKLVMFNLFELLGKDGMVGGSGGNYICNGSKMFFERGQLQPLNSFSCDNVGKKNVDLYETEVAAVRAKINQKQFVSVNECLPLYIQKSQAENMLLKNLSFGKCQEYDINALVAIEKQCFTHNIFSEEMFKEELAGKHYFYAKSGDKIVAFAGLSVLDGEGELIQVAVEPAFQNMGIGKEICEYAFNALKLKTIFLEVNKKNAAAIKLYCKLGFKQTGERKCYYNNGDDALIFRLQH